MNESDIIQFFAYHPIGKIVCMIIGGIIGLAIISFLRLVFER